MSKCKFSGRNQLIIMLARTNFNFLLQGNMLELEVYECDIMHSSGPECGNDEILAYLGDRKIGRSELF
jgi:hypothetical protein